MKHTEMVLQARNFMSNIQSCLQEEGFDTKLILDHRFVDTETGQKLQSEEFPELVYKNETIINVWACPDDWDLGGIYYIAINSDCYLDFVLAVIKHISRIAKDTKENIEIGIGFDYNKPKSI